MSARASTETDTTPHAEGAAARLGGRPLTERLSGPRWRHSLSVAETAWRLAGALGWSEAERDRALVAGLLHDVGKELPADIQRELARSHAESARRDLAGRPASTAGSRSPDSLPPIIAAPTAAAGPEGDDGGPLLQAAGAEGDDGGPLLHAAAGAALAARDYGVEDPDVLEAIACHPTGTPRPAPLAQLLFVADYLEPMRPRLDAEDRRLLRDGLARRATLGELFCRVLEKKMAHLQARGRAIHPLSLATRDAHCGGRG